MFLVDSSIYIEKMRGGVDPVKAFAAEFEAGTLLTCGIVVCEVLRGIRDQLIFDRMEDFFNLMQSVDLRKEFGNAFRMLGMTDKKEIAKGGDKFGPTPWLGVVNTINEGNSLRYP